jgi:hypothetical protein
MDESRELTQVEERQGASENRNSSAEQPCPPASSSWESYSLTILTALFDD